MTLLLLLFAFNSPLLLLPSVRCSHQCPHQCVCYEHADLVDCRARGFHHVPRGLPHGMWLLELGGNNLTEICSRAFSGLWSLRVLVMTNSQIQEIQPQVNTMGWLEGFFFFWKRLERIDSMLLWYCRKVTVESEVWKTQCVKSSSMKYWNELITLNVKPVEVLGEMKAGELHGWMKIKITDKE